MAASHKSYRFLDLGSAMAVHDHQPAFELHESDIYDSPWPSPEPQRRRKPVVKLAEDPSVPRDRIDKKVTSSLPVNIPDWLKIPREEDMGRDECCYDDEGEEECCERLPPHEFLARTRAASVSLSGRSLKGRDLSRVRNAIWAKIGFQD
ncbi:hypothetical protein MLD38_025251 [Melastoma candidum]|uniref:Uncharacterized protein n=1 Tax=Melastoma candidum TaxID=119954 RepID=A0ACB9NXN5_9MYRT|nr:hypothetical protein MLD38_025251 [Melastoma candidum]